MAYWVVKLPLVDRHDEPILVRVTPRIGGGHALDLDLLATDGEFAYETKVRERRLERLRAASYDGTPDEWSSILQHALTQQENILLSTELEKTLEIVCHISNSRPRKSLQIIFRTSVEDITHKLGAIDLQLNESATDGVDLFGWTSQVIGERDTLAREVHEIKATLQESEERIQSLQAQLEELLQAKEEHETQLLSKFTLLLNEKKLLIRTQQKQIVEQGLVTTDPKSKRPSSHARKRKKAPGTVSIKSDFDSEPLEAMDVDLSDQRSGSEQEQSEEDLVNPGQNEMESESEHLRGPVVERSQKPSAAPDWSDSSPDSTPPPRDLPFSMPAKVIVPSDEQAKESSRPTAIDEDEDTASEDDEL